MRTGRKEDEFIEMIKEKKQGSGSLPFNCLIYSWERDIEEVKEKIIRNMASWKEEEEI